MRFNVDQATDLGSRKNPVFSELRFGSVLDSEELFDNLRQTKRHVLFALSTKVYPSRCAREIFHVLEMNCFDNFKTENTYMQMHANVAARTKTL